MEDRAYSRIRILFMNCRCTKFIDTLVILLIGGDKASHIIGEIAVKII
jgi:hypothetical protein